MLVLPNSLPDLASVKSDIKSRPARWGAVLITLLLMVDTLSVLTWMTFPALKIKTTSASTSANVNKTSPKMLQLLAELEEAGANPLLSSSQVHRKSFSVPGMLLTLQGDNVQVFEYSSEAKASEEAKNFLESYARQTSNRVSWTPMAYLYSDGSLLVLYTGNREEITESLTKALGMPVGSAGGE